MILFQFAVNLYAKIKSEHENKIKAELYSEVKWSHSEVYCLFSVFYLIYY